MLASDGGAPAPRRPAARTTSSITGSPRPSHDRRLAPFFVGSPRTVGPQPHDVLRLALPAPSQTRRALSPDRRLAPFFVGSPRTVGPPPHDVLRLALPCPLQLAADVVHGDAAHDRA